MVCVKKVLNVLVSTFKYWVHTIIACTKERDTDNSLLLARSLVFCLLSFSETGVSYEPAIDITQHVPDCENYPVLCTPAKLHLIEGQEWPFALYDRNVVKQPGFGLFNEVVEVSNGDKPHALKLFSEDEYTDFHSNEVRFLSRLPSHDNILTAKAYYTNESGKVIAIVMEKARCSLGELTRNECGSYFPSHKDIQRHIKGIFSSISVLYRESIEHNDIHDENILLGEDGEMKLVDFGDAYFVEGASYNHDASLALYGIINYAKRYDSVVNTKMSNDLYQELKSLDIYSSRERLTKSQLLLAAMDINESLPSVYVEVLEGQCTLDDRHFSPFFTDDVCSKSSNEKK